VTRDLLSPIITLKTLTPEEMYVLTEKLAAIHGQVYDWSPRVDSEDLSYFIQTEYARVGADTNITPREIIRDFIEILNILFQYPDKSVKTILGGGADDGFAFASSDENDAKLHEEFQGFLL
jgi:hypothetical protein